MSTSGERKCALLLASLGKKERRKLLQKLPARSAATIRGLIGELEAMKLPLAVLADELLADEMRGLTARTSLGLDQLVQLSGSLPPSWFARVLSAWPEVDRAFCLAMLDQQTAAAVRDELESMRPLPPKLIDAIRAESAVCAQTAKEAA